MKLAGFVVIGIIISIAFCLLCAYFLGGYIDKYIQGERNSWIFVVLVFLPVSFSVGGFVTGLLSYPEMENKSGLLYISPWNIFVIPGSVLTFYVSYFFTENKFVHILLFILLVIYQYLLPVGGTALGWFIKKRIINWLWFGD